ncbi:MAG: hypothetical protein R2848_06510 [Thermomicrobiales bacterium]
MASIETGRADLELPTRSWTPELAYRMQHTMTRAISVHITAIHGGGSDLIFPHHECEIAQAENSTGVEPFVRYWVHVGMVEYQGEKMSKSLGNLVLVSNELETVFGGCVPALSHEPPLS